MFFEPYEIRPGFMPDLLAPPGSFKERNSMRILTLKFAATLCIMDIALAGVALASEIKGTVTAQGMRSPEGIVVYIDTIAGKTFAPPKEHPIMDQKKLTFIPWQLKLSRLYQMQEGMILI